MSLQIIWSISIHASSVRFGRCNVTMFNAYAQHISMLILVNEPYSWGWCEWSLVIRSMIWPVRWLIRHHDLKLRSVVASVCTTWRTSNCCVPDYYVLFRPVLSLIVLTSSSQFPECAWPLCSMSAEEDWFDRCADDRNMREDGSVLTLSTLQPQCKQAVVTLTRQQAGDETWWTQHSH